MEENREKIESAEDSARAKMFRSPNAPRKSIDFLWQFYPYRDGFFRPLEKDGSMLVGPYYTAAHIKKDPNGHYPRIVLERVDFQKMEEPDYQPKWICICDACAIRTKAVDSPEQARDDWNAVMVTRFSRMLFRKLTVENLNDCGVENLLYQMAKNSAEDLVGMYRARRKNQEKGRFDEELENRIRDLERFFRKSPFLRDLNREELLRELRQEGEKEKAKLTPEERLERQRERERKRYAERTNKNLRGLWNLTRSKKPKKTEKKKEEETCDKG